MSTTIRDGGLVTKDPDSIEVFTFDWHLHLEAGVSVATSTFTVSGADASLTLDQEAILAGARRTRVRLTGGTPQVRYTVTNRIVTDESPSQRKDASLVVLIQDN